MKSSILAFFVRDAFFRSSAYALLVLVLSWGLLFPVSYAQDQVDLSTTEDPVLIYQVNHEVLNEADILRIEIYSDGYALLHYPFYMKNAGDYAVQLERGEFQRLINTLNTPAIASFDKKALAQQKKNQDDAVGIGTFVSDASYSEFEISRINNGRAKQKIKWPHLQHDAKHYRGIKSFDHLAEVEAVLRSLINHPSAQELSNAE